MSRRNSSIRIPQYLHHKPSGTARVRIAGQEHSLGKFDSPSSYAKYDRLIAEWRAAGCPAHAPRSKQTIDELVLAYWYWASSKYTANTLERTKGAIRVLRSLYGDLPSDEFGPPC